MPERETNKPAPVSIPNLPFGRLLGQKGGREVHPLSVIPTLPIRSFIDTQDPLKALLTRLNPTATYPPALYAVSVDSIDEELLHGNPPGVVYTDPSFKEIPSMRFDTSERQTSSDMPEDLQLFKRRMARKAIKGAEQQAGNCLKNLWVELSKPVPPQKASALSTTKTLTSAALSFNPPHAPRGRRPSSNSGERQTEYPKFNPPQKGLNTRDPSKRQSDQDEVLSEIAQLRSRLDHIMMDVSN
ncbi:MAG: uncharacterized protein KVP18_003212 [Porospora cf. gigantea A]|nr:MAG: hypothetical protein KVP18_003212 [Porospora cf. gigantea A]